MEVVLTTARETLPVTGIDPDYPIYKITAQGIFTQPRSPNGAVYRYRERIVYVDAVTGDIVGYSLRHEIHDTPVPGE